MKDGRRSGTALWLLFGPENETDRFILSAHRTEPGPGVIQGGREAQSKNDPFNKVGKGAEGKKGGGGMDLLKEVSCARLTTFGGFLEVI